MLPVPPWLTRAALVFGAGVLAGIAIDRNLLIETPEHLEATREGYDEEVAALRVEASSNASAAEEAQRVAGEAVTAARASEARAVALETEARLPAPEAPAPLPAAVIARTPPEVLARLEYFEKVFVPQATANDAALRAVIAEQGKALTFWKRAHAGAQEAAEKWRVAHDAEKERGDLAVARVDEYERVHFRRRWFTWGATCGIPIRRELATDLTCVAGVGINFGALH